MPAPGGRPDLYATGISAGLDGRVFNGSLLPARLAMDGVLTSHWSVLTAIGDGVVFIQSREGRAAGDVVREVGWRVRDSGVPGVVVLNLHPQNIEKTQDMHAAARELVQQGFVAWTVADMISWFGQRDAICADTGAAYEYGLSLMSMSPQTRPLDTQSFFSCACRNSLTEHCRFVRDA